MRKVLTTLGVLIVPLLAVEALAVGALAIDESQGNRHGWAVNYKTQAEADARALQECGQGCRIVHRFSNTCKALAMDQTPGSTSYGHGHAPTSAEAQANAMRFCRQYGGSNCLLRVWGCDTTAPAETPVAEAEVDGADSPVVSAAESVKGNQRRWAQQVGEATARWPSSACEQARDETDGYALWDQYIVTNDSGCSCVREQKPDWDKSAPGWTCKVSVIYDRREAVTDREVRVGTGTGYSRDVACSSVSYEGLLKKLSLMHGSKSNWTSSRDSGCFCPVENDEGEWYCERVVRYYK